MNIFLLVKFLMGESASVRHNDVLLLIYMMRIYEWLCEVLTPTMWKGLAASQLDDHFFMNLVSVEVGPDQLEGLGSNLNQETFFLVPGWCQF